MTTPLIWGVLIVGMVIAQGNAMKTMCGKERIDDENKICCEGFPHVKSWDSQTRCCGLFAYNPKLESCCDDMINPGFGNQNQFSKCCADVSYDKRCYECEDNIVMPLFNFKSETCCEGKIRRLLENKTCCCGTEVFDPTDLVCCDEEIVKRPDDMPGECCSCGLTKVDIVVILDASESIQSSNWPKMLKFVTEILSDAEIDNDNVRVGILTYRHNATVEFHLDDFHNKNKMFAAVRQIKYVRGSTNTGMAIEMARTEMFNRHRGDRPGVDNVAIVVTDGDSDNYGHTIEQADLAKDANIHVFAIGINLQNLTELKNIASEPAKDNVLSIDDFDHLESLKGQIFASICTGAPIITIYKPCGKDFYLPGREMCCNGKPQPLVAGSKTKCCNQKSYDDSQDICCDGVVSALKGPGTVCCGSKAMDPKIELCCGKDPVPKPDEDSTECCDIYAYNPKKEVCCEGYVSKAYGNPNKDTACCVDFSYDTRCWECVDGQIGPLFDPDCEMCCDGSIQSMDPGLSCCCGKELFQPDTKICCNGELRKRKGGEMETDCCECGSALVDLAIVLDSSESVGSDSWKLLINFVEDLIQGSEIDSGRTRMAMVVYRHNVTNEFPFNKYLRTANMLSHVRNVPYIRGSTNTGGALEDLRKKIFTHEAGDRNDVPDVAIVILDGTSDDPDYTIEQASLLKDMGVRVYAIAVGIKTNDELKAIASDPWNENVFSVKNFGALRSLQNKIYDVISDVCPQSATEQKCKEPCGDDGNLYDPVTEVCCNGEPQPIMGGSLKNTECCDQRSYDKREEMCCSGRVDVKPSGKPECCNTESIDAKTQICCNGKVNVRANKEVLCCDKEAYDPRDAICCYDTVVLPKASNSASECCGNSTYDPYGELCCDDVIYLNYGPEGDSGECCVPEESNETISYDTRCYDCDEPLYDCAFERCCDGAIQEIYWPYSCCCANVAFNPDDHICCDGKIRPRTPEDDPTCCECGNNIMDIVVVLDSSESVGLDNWRKMELFVEDLISDATVPDARFGLLSYKHNVSLEFYLNTFFAKKEMLKAVDNLPYTRGSTNTGMALEVARKQMFTPRTGDRSNAPNFIILITDGQSDDFSYTKQQAELARAQGIQIIALGVGLEDVKELRAVASPPLDDNAIPLKDFKELEKVKQRLFNDLAKSGCPQRPKDRCRTPCGNSSIDERTELCCEGNPQKKIAGDKTLCCGTVAYDPDCFICCEDHLVSRYAGEFTECCCKFAYDSRTHLCCGNQILPKVAGKLTECCHNETFDPSTQVCCDLITVQPSYGKDNTECCRGESYDTRCYECGKKGVAPIFDPKTELCCDGVIGEKKFGEKSCCCGKKQFNADIGICCEDNYYDRPEGDEVTCCGKNIHNAKKEICCDDNVQPRVNGFDTGCCLAKSFDPRKMHCCEGKLNKKSSDKDTCCCGDTVFDFDSSICCDGKVSKLTKKGNRNSSVCCGSASFDPLKKICCDNKVAKLQKKGASSVCCGTKTYDPKKKVCEDGKIKSISKECGFRKYDAKTQTCCNGCINNGTFKEPWGRCCFGEAYDARQKVCCCNGNLEDAVAGIFTQCCYSYAYDSRTHTCCDGQIVRKPYPSAECCCERQAYDSNREICCGGKVRACGGDKRQCCGTEAYDPVLEICCDGKLHDRRFGDETYCCGTEAYTPMLAVCCGERIAYEKKINLEW